MIKRLHGQAVRWRRAVTRYVAADRDVPGYFRRGEMVRVRPGYTGDSERAKYAGSGAEWATGYREPRGLTEMVK